MDNITLLPADTYIVYNKTILNDFDKKILISFYEPIVGYLPISLYLSLWNDLDNLEISREYTHHHLMSILRSKLDLIREARSSLEAVGLLKTYIHKDLKKYVYELYSPLTPSEFFNHPILNVVLYNNVGSTEYERLKSNYQKKKIDLKDYKDISKMIDEVYTSSSDIPTFTAIDRTIGNISCDNQVDFDFIMSSIPKGIINDKALNKKTRELINELAFLYKMNSLKMTEVIRSVLNEYGMIDKNNLRIACRKVYEFNHNSLPTLVYRSQPEYLKSPKGDDTPKGKIIQIFENINPVDYLRIKNKGSKPTNSEMKIIEQLIIDMEMKPAVVNVLLDYVLRKNNNKLNKGYIETIAGQWKRANLKTAEEAMKFAEKENKRMSRKEYKESKSDDKKPIWFDKNLQSAKISEEEQAELEDMIKEFE